MQGRVTRRSFLAGSGSVALAAGAGGLLAACGGGSRSSATIGGDAVPELTSKSVVFADYGGSTREARARAYFEPFERETGVRVVPADADNAKLRLMAERDRSLWDVCELDPVNTAQLVDADLLQPFPSSLALSPLVPGAYRRFNVGGYMQSINLGYRSDVLRRRPESWADFWDTERFPGKRALPANFLVEVALLADGVPVDRVQPYDFDRAFAKLDELRPSALYFDDLAQGQQMLQSGAATMIILQNARLADLQNQRVPVELVWNQALQGRWLGPAVPRGAEHADAAAHLAEFMTDPGRQAEFSRITTYGPTNPKALELLDDRLLARIPNTREHLEVAFQYDTALSAQQQDEYVRRTTEWLAQS